MRRLDKPRSKRAAEKDFLRLGGFLLRFGWVIGWPAKDPGKSYLDYAPAEVALMLKAKHLADDITRIRKAEADKIIEQLRWEEFENDTEMCLFYYKMRKKQDALTNELERRLADVCQEWRTLENTAKEVARTLMEEDHG